MKQLVLAVSLLLSLPVLAQSNEGPRNMNQHAEGPRNIGLGASLFHLLTAGIFTGPRTVEYVKANCKDADKQWTMKFYSGRECNDAECFIARRVAFISKADGKTYNYSSTHGATRFTNPSLKFLKVLTPNGGEVVELTCDTEIMNDNSYQWISVWGSGDERPLAFDRESPEIVKSASSIETSYF